jgi:Zn-dependent protease with chaperone function
MSTVAKGAASVPWLDPRRWSALIRAHGLFLAFATLAEYGLVVAVVFGPWLPTPRQAEDLGVSLPLAYLATFALPFAVSQVLSGAWLLFVARPRRPLSEERTHSLALEALAAAGTSLRGYRRPVVLMGRVSQPHVLSILGRPYLVLPEGGLTLYSHLLGAEADPAFRAAVAHEAGHLKSADDLLFLPWSTYMAALFLFCLVGVLRVAGGTLSWTLMVSHLISVGLLVPLGLYAIRRREAYADSVAVTAFRAVAPVRAALATVPANAHGRLLSWLATHFDANQRGEWISGAGRPFLALSRRDLILVALIYFTLDISPFSMLASGGGGAQFELAIWLGELTKFLMVLLFVLTLAGASLARRGAPVPFVDAAIAATICVFAQQARGALQRGMFSLSQMTFVVAAGCASLVGGALLFVAVTRVLNLWTVAIAGRPGGDVQDRLVGGASLLAAAFAVPQALAFMLLIHLVRGIDGRQLEALAQASSEEQIRAFLPMILGVVALWVVLACLAAAVVLWSVVRSRRLPPLSCGICGESNPSRAQERLLTTCVRCGSLLRQDMFLPVAP